MKKNHKLLFSLPKNKVNGGDEVPRTIIFINTIKSYLIGLNSIFYAFYILLDLLRPAEICYFVVGRDR
jgi:hypothetical protein